MVTPNLDEVRLLVGIDVHDRAAQYRAAKALHAFGPRYVLVKGGHLVEDTDVCVDLLYDGDSFTELPGPRFDTGHTHGGGDNMAAAIASGLARGLAVPDAVRAGQAVRGRGRAPVLPARRRARPGLAAVDGAAVVDDGCPAGRSEQRSRRVASAN